MGNNELTVKLYETIRGRHERLGVQSSGYISHHCPRGKHSGAARKLELSPPAVSHALKLLESHLGLPLFTRTTRTIELTEAGKCLMGQASPAMDALYRALESVQDLSQVPSGKVRITVPRFAYQLIVQPIYAEFCSLYPEIELEISVSNTSINIIKEGYDAGIRFGHRIEEGMVARPLMPPMKEALFATADYLERFGTPAARKICSIIN